MPSFFLNHFHDTPISHITQAAATYTLVGGIDTGVCADSGTRDYARVASFNIGQNETAIVCHFLVILKHLHTVLIIAKCKFDPQLLFRFKSLYISSVKYFLYHLS